jgi:hypothetical protein
LRAIAPKLGVKAVLTPACRHRVDEEAAEYILIHIDPTPGQARIPALRALCDRAVVAAVKAARERRRTSTEADDARRLVVRARAAGGYWLDALEQRRERLEQEAAVWRLEAYVRSEEKAREARAVRAGALSSWAASRILVPLARANNEHAEQLLQALGRERLSRRDRKQWFEHCRSGSCAVRERTVDHPRLLLRALAERQVEQRGPARWPGRRLRERDPPDRGGDCAAADFAARSRGSDHSDALRRTGAGGARQYHHLVGDT